MLVLSRKVGQELVIGDNIRLVVQRVSGNRVAIGIQAPHEVHIVRGELKAVHDEFDDEPVISPERYGAPVLADQPSQAYARVAR